MKKTTLFTAAALSTICLGGQVLTAQAAPKNQMQVQLNGKSVIVSYNSCSTQTLADLLKDCFPNICLPGTNLPGFELLDCNIPETEVPDAEAPDTTPDAETPDSNTPDTEAPDNNAPDIDTPDNNTPEVETPDNNTPDMDTPDNDTPEVETPDNNLPDTNIPDTNLPGTNTPDIELPDKDDAITEDTEVSPYIAEVVSLVNAERAKEGLAPLTINVQVQAAAQIRAMECEQSFSHTRPNGTSFSTALKEQNVSYRSAGENIAWGQRSPKEVMNAWMNSEGHRANIMNPNYTSIGVGYYQNANGTNYWCQLFIR